MTQKLVAVIALAVIVTAGYLYWQSTIVDAKGADGWYGNVDIRETRLGFRTGGRVSDMLREEGDLVSAGELLAVIDDRPAREALAVAEAGVAEAEARVALLRSGSRPQEIEQARSMVQESEAGLANARRELRRQSELVEKGLGNDRDVDLARTARDQRAARLAANKEALELATEGFRAEELLAAEAGLAAARARRDQAQTSLEDTRLVAPLDGIIQTRVIEPGTVVAVGAPVYTLTLTDTVYVRAYVRGEELSQMVPGTAVKITVDGVDKAYNGQIGFVSPRAEFTPKSVETPDLRTDFVYRVRIVVADADDRLRQGMPVTLALK